jgi:hypothetical protein
MNDLSLMSYVHYGQPDREEIHGKPTAVTVVQYLNLDRATMRLL